MSTTHARFATVALCLSACLPAYAADARAPIVRHRTRCANIPHSRSTAATTSRPVSDKAEDIGWQYVSEDVRLQDIRRAKPDAIKARRIPANNFIALIDGAVASPKPKEEKFSNTKIETDGDVASVSFDYSFHDDGVKTNWGKEMWQLIRTEQGWKIFSVIYSIRDSRSPAE
ncbi:hypothetical protein [Stenotrophomonas maltophilia]|uniref:hypothetical protein n=1 Tax=Stenotrophomonas maltophilia TaxID=40324 RepID=UPI000D0B4068|nr:hypothetical protein [Stenotrophomonas maltophilia]AVO30743.1 hypothetical protein C6Y55_12810 [Stenotrophomonas maltophilia]